MGEGDSLRRMAVVCSEIEIGAPVECVWQILTGRGRKNHYGSRSERGTRVAAMFYSLIESAKLCGVEPRAYLRAATLRAVRNPDTITLARELKSSES